MASFAEPSSCWKASHGWCNRLLHHAGAARGRRGVRHGQQRETEAGPIQWKEGTRDYLLWRCGRVRTAGFDAGRAGTSPLRQAASLAGSAAHSFRRDPARRRQSYSSPCDKLIGFVEQPLRRAPKRELDSLALLAVIQGRKGRGFLERRAI